MATKKATSPKKTGSKPKALYEAPLTKAAGSSLKKLSALGIEEKLQADIEWCLGSYAYDKNPAGLYEVIGRALAVFKEQKEKGTKGISQKLLKDLESLMK